jgi:two-component system cell cycle response regulator
MARFANLIQALQLCSIESASDAAEAMSLVQAQQPDVLLMCWDEPGGLDLCRTLKEQSRLSWIYVILVGPVIWQEWWGAIAASRMLHQEQLAIDAGADTFAWYAADSTGDDLGALSGLDASEGVPEMDGGWRHTLEGDCSLCPTDSPSRAWAPFQAHHVHDRLMRSLGFKIQAGLRRVHNYRELMRTNDLLSAIALSDPLTELNNRRAFEWELPRQIQNARTRKAPISLLVLDVDFFKSINDNYGHLVGDRALQLIAARLRHNLRFCDTPFRYGGEEFIVILNDTDEAEALRVGQRLRRRMAEKPFALSDTLDVTITISIGSASLLPSDDERGTSLLNRADHNLLLAKSRGRNQVVSSQDTAPGC